MFTTMVSRRLAEDVTLWIILAETDNVGCFNRDAIGHESRECPENMPCCICREEDHMPLDCPHSWSRHPAS